MFNGHPVFYWGSMLGIFTRTWGHFESVAEGEGYLLKHLYIEPGRSTSLQTHEHRDEKWRVVSGEGTVIIGEDMLDAKPGNYFTVGRGVKHKIINNGLLTLEISEIWTGDDLREDDIVRYAE